MGHVAVRGAFPAAWRKTFPEVGKRKGGQAFDALPAIAFWIDDGVATCGLTQQQAEAAYGDDAACASAKFSETVKACVQPRPDDEFLKVVFRKSSGAIVGVRAGVRGGSRRRRGRELDPPRAGSPAGRVRPHAVQRRYTSSAKTRRR